MGCAEKRSVTLLRHGLRPRNPRPTRRGFTLIELLITVAMVGVLAALGLVGYRRYVHTAQSSEAKAVIQGIRGGQEGYKAEFLQYVDVSQQDFTDHYPNKTPNDSRMNWVQPADTRYTDAGHGWALLNVSTDGPVRFGYTTVAGVGGTLKQPTMMQSKPAMPTVAAGVPWYVIQAVNKHNPTIAAGAYAVFASASTSGEILSENEQE